MELKRGKLYRTKLPIGNLWDRTGVLHSVRHNTILLFLSQNESKKFKNGTNFYFLFEKKILKGILDSKLDRVEDFFERVECY